MVMEKDMTKNMDKAMRLANSTKARLKRKKTKSVIRQRTENLFAKLRRERRSK
jgi:hypothetical protein